MSEKDCERRICRNLGISGLVLMILIFILAIIWFALDMTHRLSMHNAGYFAMGVFIFALIGAVVLSVAVYRCRECTVCVA